MHCIELAELASLLAHHSPMLVAMRVRIAENALVDYWVQCRKRLDRWHARLGDYQTLESAVDAPRLASATRAWWAAHQALIDEILLAEIHVRVFAATASAIDAATHSQEASPIAHNVFLAHLDARNRVMRLLLHGRGASVEQTAQWNKLRRSTERWTDRLLAPLIAADSQSIVYAYDPARAHAYAIEWREESDPTTQRLSATLGRMSMRSTLQSRVNGRTATPHSNRQIADSILSCLSQQCFDDLGIMRSSAHLRFVQPGDAGDRKPTSNLFPSHIGDNLKPSVKLPTRWFL